MRVTGARTRPSLNEMLFAESMKTLSAASLVFLALAVALPAQTNTNPAAPLAVPPDLQLVPPKSPSAKVPPLFDAAIPALGDSLLDACRQSDVKHATDLLNQGAPVNFEGKYGDTPLLLAAMRSPEMVKLLLTYHPNLELRENHGYTALGVACWTGKTECAIELMDAGANIETINDNGHTPLILAIEYGNDDLVKALIAHHADVNKATVNGSAIWWAVGKDRVAETTMLLNAGADFLPHMTLSEDPKHPWYTLMAKAALSNDPAMVDLLLSHGAKINETNSVGRTPLTMALQFVRAPMILHLLDKGADVNAADSKGNTPLAYANDRGETELAKLLVQHGAKPVELHIIPKEMPSPALSIPHRWALAVSALYSQLNGKNPNVLGGEDSPAAAKHLLGEWKIYDQKSLQREVDYLRSPGYHTAIQLRGKTLAALPNWLFWLLTYSDTKPHNESKAIRQNYLIWKERSDLGIDLCRAADLVNVAYACHYINEDQAWNLLMPVARDAQTNFKSWHEMCDNLLDSREMSSGAVDPRLDACGDLLCNAKDPNSPWNQLPWTSDLSAP
jgi:ankyrin repeat protein